MKVHVHKSTHDNTKTRMGCFPHQKQNSTNNFSLAKQAQKGAVDLCCFRFRRVRHRMKNSMVMKRCTRSDAFDAVSTRLYVCLFFFYFRLLVCGRKLFCFCLLCFFWAIVRTFVVLFLCSFVVLVVLVAYCPKSKVHNIIREGSACKI